MPRSRFFAAAALIVAAGPVATAVAQPQPPIAPQRPAISPYLSLLYPGASPGFNYLGFVQPQLQAQQNFATLSQQLQQTNASLQGLNGGVYGVDPNLPLTGHAAVFNNTGHYFRSNPIYGGGGGGGFGFNSYGYGSGAGGFAGGGGFGGGMPRPASTAGGGLINPGMSGPGAGFGR